MAYVHKMGKYFKQLQSLTGKVRDTLLSVYSSLSLKKVGFYKVIYKGPQLYMQTLITCQLSYKVQHSAI